MHRCLPQKTGQHLDLSAMPCTGPPGPGARGAHAASLSLRYLRADSRKSCGAPPGDGVRVPGPGESRNHGKVVKRRRRGPQEHDPSMTIRSGPDPPPRGPHKAARNSSQEQPHLDDTSGTDDLDDTGQYPLVWVRPRPQGPVSPDAPHQTVHFRQALAQIRPRSGMLMSNMFEHRPICCRLWTDIWQARAI